jgi:hypothetical protein
MSAKRIFLYVIMFVTICEVTGLTVLVKQENVFCYAVGCVETPAEEDETRAESEDPHDFFCESTFALSFLISIDPFFVCSFCSNLPLPFTEIVVPPPQLG